MPTSKKSNTLLVKKSQAILKEFGYEVKLGHLYEMYSQLAGFNSYNVAATKGADLNPIQPKATEKVKQPKATEKDAFGFKFGFKKVGDWLYYHDGGAGAYYAKTDAETLLNFIKIDDCSNPAPFEIIIPESKFIIHFYSKGEDYPSRSVNIQSYNATFGTEYQSIEEFLTGEDSNGYRGR